MKLSSPMMSPHFRILRTSVGPAPNIYCYHGDSTDTCTCSVWHTIIKWYRNYLDSSLRPQAQDWLLFSGKNKGQKYLV